MENASSGPAIVAQQIRDLISRAQFRLHERLPPERELATQIGVSRNTLRAALHILEEDGRIWRHVGLGTFVGGRPRPIRNPPTWVTSGTSLSEILEARYHTEPIVAGLAAVRADDRDIAMMEGFAKSALYSKTWAEWEKWDELFHRAIAEASGNGLLINSVDELLLIKTQERWTMRHAPCFDQKLVERYDTDHKAIIFGIVGRDSATAEAAMRRHIGGVRHTIGPVIKSSIDVKNSALR